MFSCEFWEIFKNTVFIEELRNTAFKGTFFLFLSLSFSSFENYRLNWKCEYMKRNSWKFLQISWRFLTFTWLNEYFEWVDRYMNFLPQSMFHLCICCRRKGKGILMFVCLIEKISHPLTGIGHQVYLLKKFNFSILYSSQCSVSLLASRLPRYLIRDCSCFMGWYFRFKIFFFVNKKFLSYGFCVKELRSEYLEYLPFSNRIALERVKLYHKPPEGHTIYDKVNPPINFFFLLSALNNKHLILS